jgi:hypothetical protein
VTGRFAFDAATGNPLSDVIQIYGEDGGGSVSPSFHRTVDGCWLSRVMKSGGSIRSESQEN